MNKQKLHRRVNPRSKYKSPNDSSKISVYKRLPEAVNKITHASLCMVDGPASRFFKSKVYIYRTGVERPKISGSSSSSSSSKRCCMRFSLLFWFKRCDGCSSLIVLPFFLPSFLSFTHTACKSDVVVVVAAAVVVKRAPKPNSPSRMLQDLFPAFGFASALQLQHGPDGKPQ